MVSQFVYHIHLHYIVEKQFHPASSVHVKHHQATGSHVEDDGRLAHAGLNCSPAATDGYQSCKILTKNHIFHMKPNSWTCSTTIFEPPATTVYISYIISLSLFNHAPKKLKHNKIPVVWLPKLLHIFLNWCSFCHCTVVEQTTPLPSLHPSSTCMSTFFLE